MISQVLQMQAVHFLVLLKQQVALHSLEPALQAHNSTELLQIQQHLFWRHEKSFQTDCLDSSAQLRDRASHEASY